MAEEQNKMEATPMNWEFPYPSRRMPVMARNCVATSQPLAAQAGLSMLAKGGNAIDAAIATAIALTVVEPCSNGLGSDAFAIVWDGKRLHGLNASGRSPAAGLPTGLPARRCRMRGWNSATVPGAVAAWAELSRKFGRLPLADLYEPAIRYATDGFLVSPTIATIWGNQVERLHSQTGFTETFLPHGRRAAPGEHFRPPHQAATLKKLAESGGESLYRGELAATIAPRGGRDGG